MKFTYSVPNINEIESVACGHERGPHTVLKMGTRPAILMADPRQAELYGEVTGSYIYIGFKNLMESKPAFDCRLVYSGLIYFSGQITFKVYGKYSGFYDYLDLDFKFYDYNNEPQSKWMEIISKATKNLLIGVFYRHPTKESNDEFNNNLRITLRGLSYRMEQRGAEGISKFAVTLCSPMQQTATVDIAPKHLHK